MLAAACLLAGVYGVLHNQISYSVGPDYFHAFKFRQFRVPIDLHGRMGAALVGLRASWWMGLVIGGPLAVLSLFHPAPQAARRAFAYIAIGIVVLTLAVGLASLAIGVPDRFRAMVWVPGQVENAQGFMRAAWMHEITYGASLLSLFIGLIMMIWMVIRARRAR
ncbi:MAG: hypothetical protein AAFN59_07835 [Pseudomonadota bacterium]